MHGGSFPLGSPARNRSLCLAQQRNEIDHRDGRFKHAIGKSMEAFITPNAGFGSIKGFI